MCLILALATGTASAASAPEEKNRALVIEFYDAVFNRHDLSSVTQVVSEDYVQHNPRIASGRAAFTTFMANRFKQTPQSRSEILRTAVDGDLVYLHNRSMNDPSDRGTAIVNIFRVTDGKITEHWDVVQPVPETAANSNTMF